MKSISKPKNIRISFRMDELMYRDVLNVIDHSEMTMSHLYRLGVSLALNSADDQINQNLEAEND